jgi:phage terminase large subunit
MRYKGIKGGRGSGKSHVLADNVLDLCLDNDLRIVFVREVQKSLDQSSKLLLEDKIKQYGLGYRMGATKTHIQVGANGRISFVGMQNHTADAVRSLEGCDLAVISEARSLSAKSLEVLRPTIRADDSELWADWNPELSSDPIDKLFVGDPHPQSICVTANWTDNPWFPKVLREDMEYDRKRDSDKFDHIWGGNYIKHSEARVFKNWVEEAFDTPAEAEFYFGGDWGFSVDPTVLIRCFIIDRTLYVDQEAYKVGCEIDHLPALFAGDDERWKNPNNFPGIPGALRWNIKADSARPETISYMRRQGFRISPAKKGPGSVEEGVEFLKNYDIKVHPRCKHTIDELKFYAYKRDRLTDEILPVLEDKHNHVIDSLRYAVEGVRRSGGPRIS